MMYPLVREMAAPNAPLRVPVAVACRVLGFSEQGYYQWRTQPIAARQQEEEHLIEVVHELHEDDPEGGYRVLADNAPRSGLPDLGAARVVTTPLWSHSSRSCRRTSSTGNAGPPAKNYD